MHADGNRKRSQWSWHLVTEVLHEHQGGSSYKILMSEARKSRETIPVLFQFHNIGCFAQHPEEKPYNVGTKSR